jgi:dTDP-4-dehydrorhamnose reductase
MSRRPPEGIRAFHLDKRDLGQVKSVIDHAQPEVVVDTGALHNVDYCELHPEEAYKINAVATGEIASLCARQGTRYIFVSTDYVFDGTKGLYEESDPPNPLSLYGKSKLEGEGRALAQGDQVSVVRPSVIFSWDSSAGTTSSGKPLNFAMWLHNELKNGRPVRIVRDQVASPTLADDLARAILAVAGANVHGVFHTAGRTPLSRYDFAVKLAELFGFDTELITPIVTSELKQVAKRPMNSSLTSKRIEVEVGHRMMSIDESLGVFSETTNRSR